MATQTSRLALRKPNPDPTTGDNVDVETDINENMDKIDAAIGATICTSGTRPTGADRWNGRLIKETDTKRVYVWDAPTVSWIQLLTSAEFVETLRKWKTAEPQNNTTTLMSDPELVFNVPSAGRWQFFGPIWFGTSAAADFKMTFICDESAITEVRWSVSGNTQMFFDGQIANIAQVNTFQAVDVMGHFNSSGPGTVTLQWAQQTADAGPTRVLNNSWLRAEKAG